MSTAGMITRASVAAAGGLLLAGVAGAAFAADPVGPDSDVDVNVTIESITPPGVLSMTVAQNSTTLTENGSDAEVRQFTGTLPTVSVSDTRTVDEIPDEAYWYVVGSASSFVGDAGQPDITADHLGWTPALVSDPGDGEVAVGDQVDTVLDPGPNNVGLVDQELLAMALSSDGATANAPWTANADLFLKVPVDVEAGTYQSTLTLSLFE